MSNMPLTDEDFMEMAGLGLVTNSAAQNQPKPVYKVEPWQASDIDHLANRDWSANWSEMGCYKTSTGLWLIDRKIKEAKIENPSILIVTSKSGKGTFYQAIPNLPEFEGFELFDVGTQSISIFRDGKWAKLQGLEYLPKQVTMPHVVLSHYDVFSRCNKHVFEVDPATHQVLKNPDGSIKFKPWTQADYLLDRKWDFVIVDEFHRMKNKDAKWTVNLKGLRATYRHGMTGTGFINRPDEIWSLLNFLNKRSFTSYWDFRKKYCEEDDSDGYRTVVGVKQEEKESFRELVRTVGVRRTLTEVMPHIKEPIFVRRDVELSVTQKRMYKELMMELQTLDSKGVPLMSPNVLALLSRLRQICVATPEVVDEYYDEKQERRVVKIKLTEPSSKLDELMDIIDELEWDEDDKQPVVVFSNFKGPLELLKVRFNKANEKARMQGIAQPYPYIHLAQEDNDQTRYEKWAIQFPRLQHRVFMATLQLGSESINLTPAHHVVFLDRSWSPKDNSQGIGRIRRPGQEGQPVVINIEATNTTDQRIEDVNNTKQGWFREIFGSAVI